jgi:hypothetical protein
MTVGADNFTASSRRAKPIPAPSARNDHVGQVGRNGNTCMTQALVIYK